MRNLTGLAAALFLLMTGPASADTDVTVVVTGVAEGTGSLVVTIFASEDDWLKRPHSVESVELNDELVSGPVEIALSLPAGSYAFQVYHDLDGNGEMKTNFIGIPKEPIGTSNDAKGKFGPPKFKDAVVEIGEGEFTVPINMVEI